MPQRLEGWLRGVARRYVASRRAYDDLAARHEALAVEKQQLADTYRTWVPPGHFYSPYPNLGEVQKRAGVLFDGEPLPPGMDLRDDEQCDLFESLAPLAAGLAFTEEETPERRYFFGNPEYSWSDGIILHVMLRHLRPKRVIEVGSGYSSVMTLDTIDGWLGGETDLTLIEPYPALLRGLLRPGDEERITVVEQAVQDVPLETFEELASGDVLFIDSTHVVKAGSDVNYLFFEVLPRLKDGVWVHVHDIFFPFEYPMEWLVEGRAWQENYLLRAFLMYNRRFEVRWFQQYMWTRHRALLEGRIPEMARNPGGNIWLCKVGEG